MQRVEGELVLSPTDLTKHLACPHVTTLDLHWSDPARRGGSALGSDARGPLAADDALQLVFDLGMAHERRYLDALRAEGRTIVEIAQAATVAERAQREDETVEAMRAGADVVYQGMFHHGGWTGQADFLMRTEVSSAFGSWSYEVADTKLSRKLKVAALLQTAAYSERLSELQQLEPEHVYVVTGDGESRPWRLVDVAAYARRARVRLRTAVEMPEVTEAVPVAYCSQCRWIAACAGHWRRSDDLSLVAFLGGDQRRVLREAGISTVAALAAASPTDLPRSIGRATRERLVHQALLQVWERRHGVPRYDLLPAAPGAGLLRLPPPDSGDLYLDFEGDPFADDGEGREYLTGLGDTAGGFTAMWAHDHAAEREVTVALVDRMIEQWQRHPGMHVYHYAPYETTALKRLTGRHGVREAELDQLLRGGRFVDLYAVVRQGLRISKESYSIKKLEAFYWGAVRSANPEVADALASVVAYERWCVTPDADILASIEAYNADDVRSTRDLHRWLEERRAELADRPELWREAMECPDGPLPRPGEGKALDQTAPGDAELAEIALAQRLTDAGHDLLAGLVQYHRREAKPAWWELFRLQDLDEDELVDDRAPIGRLGPPVDAGIEKRSRLYRYTFPPQDTAVRVGDDALEVVGLAKAGTVHDIDPVAGWVVLKCTGDAATPAAIVSGAGKPMMDDVLRRGIAAVAADRLAGRRSLGTALLDGDVPVALGTAPLADVPLRAGAGRAEASDGDAAAHRLVQTGLELDGTVLAVQGPPGSGKTTQGAELIRALLDAGRTVGVTANSHAVIGNLLRAVRRPGVQKCEPDVHCGVDDIVGVSDNPRVVAALDEGARLVGGTAWLFAREELAGRFDVIVVDEAAQFSLANAVAISRAARSMVLLGDPQQLAQPIRALHPPGAAASALGHLIGEHDTMPRDRGVFLPTTYRMHPDITSYVSDLSYEGRLHSAPDLARRRIDTDGPSGSGLRLLKVSHVDNVSSSAEEAEAVAALWRALTVGRYTDIDGSTRPMTVDDVLVVAPYNAQVALLCEALPGACVGTVDRFQGQQAPVVVYSMASSSSADAPRGVGFLYDVHRLNVAVSRAQAMAIVVCSPRLLDAPVQTPEDLRAVNALCRYAEVAQRL